MRPAGYGALQPPSPEKVKSHNLVASYPKTFESMRAMRLFPCVHTYALARILTLALVGWGISLLPFSLKPPPVPPSDPLLVVQKPQQEKGGSYASSTLTLEAFTRCVAQNLNVDEALALAVLIQESDPTDPLKVGKGGSKGPLQVKPIALKEVGLKPQERSLPMLIYGGILYLKEMLVRFSSLPAALAAYNMGPTRLKERGFHPYAHTQRYVRQILARIPQIRSGVLPSHPVLRYRLSSRELASVAADLEDLEKCFETVGSA